MQMKRRNAGRAAVPTFRTYTAPGLYHSILPRPRMYVLTVDDTPFIDWLTDLVEGKPVKDVGGT